MVLPMQLIDMMNICKGPVEYDVARTYFLLEGNKEFQNKYLKYMGYKVKELIPYLEVIMLIREKELKILNRQWNLCIPQSRRETVPVWDFLLWKLLWMIWK